jgi:dihydropteroate synthase
MLVADNPIVMGIINITPDSFYAGSRYDELDAVLKLAEQMIRDGAAIIDIGGQSSRPGSQLLSAEEEIKRVLDPVAAIHHRFPETIISIDTFHAAVAKEVVAAGASVVNDISSGELDEKMIETVAALKTPYIAMHMKGTPQTMHLNPVYDNVVREVLDYFIQKLAVLHAAGIHDVIADPGFGFGKTISHNFQLLQQLEAFKILGRPVLAGLSRKSIVYKTLGLTAGEALNGTTVLNTIALQNGAGILRVHDVKEAVEAVKLFTAYKRA